MALSFHHLNILFAPLFQKKLLSLLISFNDPFWMPTFAGMTESKTVLKNMSFPLKEAIPLGNLKTRHS